jgi:hypothetical protein
MALIVETIQEDGASVAHLGVTTALDRLWTSEDESTFPWLTTIDPYGDTTFNYRQLKHVNRELVAFRKRIDTEAELGEIDHLMRWISSVPDEHVYLRLVGE